MSAAYFVFDNPTYLKSRFEFQLGFSIVSGKLLFIEGERFFPSLISKISSFTS